MGSRRIAYCVDHAPVSGLHIQREEGTLPQLRAYRVRPCLPGQFRLLHAARDALDSVGDFLGGRLIPYSIEG
jgi:hypothetical protein